MAVGVGVVGRVLDAITLAVPLLEGGPVVVRDASFRVIQNVASGSGAWLNTKLGPVATLEAWA